MWFENGLREPARPCCFPAAGCFFWGFWPVPVAVKGASASYREFRPKPEYIVDSDATFASGAGGNVVRKWASWTGQANAVSLLRYLFLGLLTCPCGSQESQFKPKPEYILYSGFRRNVCTNLALPWGDRAEPPTPWEGFPGTSQATGESLQALIEGVPVPGRIQLFQRHGVAQMEWVPRRPLGRAFSSKIWE